jgi:cell division protein FtsI/penicillin-binding protein 2
MANHPGFDLNDYQDYEQDLYKTLGISYTYEPGSTFKIINVATAIENNTVGPDQLFNLPPSIQVGDKVIKEIFRTYNIDYTTSEIIQNSSNVGAVTVALSMGKKMFYEGIIDFGFRKQTGIDLPGEEIGILMDYDIWPSSTIGALAIGQTISVTPLQLVRAASAIANGGYLVTPHLLKELDFSNEKADFPEFEEKDRVISEYTSSCLKDMMLSVVEDGTGTRAQIEDIQVCGKTGTAQKPNESGIGYTEGRVITSFLGFAPYEDPEVAVLIVVDEPKGNENEIWGGTVAAPVFKDIVSFALNRLKMLDINN